MIIASLAAFLNTGRLGPLVPGMALNDVARAVGPPFWWEVVGDGNVEVPVPYYWYYHDHLEVSFSFEGPAHCEWFQIEYASSMSGLAVRVCDNIVMSLDGLTGKSPISAYISAIADLDRVRVRIIDDAGYPNPGIIIDDVEIVFGCDDDAFSADMTISDQVRFVEAGAQIDSIYSFNRDKYRLKRLAWYQEEGRPRLLNGRDYLSLCRAETDGDRV